MPRHSRFCCQTCGAFLNPDGDCEWCEWFDRIHDHPRDEPVKDPIPLDERQEMAARSFTLRVGSDLSESEGGRA